LLWAVGSLVALASPVTSSCTYLDV